MQRISCSVEILTRNSEATLRRCLESVKDFAEVIILDGNSTDKTLDIAGRYGAKIFKQFETSEPNVVISDWSLVRNKGLSLSSFDWFMYIDADEYLSPGAVEEIRSIVENPSPEAFVWWQPRLYVIDGKIINCATTYPNQQIRFFHKKWVCGFIKPVHERIKVKEGAAIGTLKSFEYVPLESIESLKAKWERYIKIEEKMQVDANRFKLCRLVLKQTALFCLYTLRYLRNLIFCRGLKMPLSYEWSRHYYLIKSIFVFSRKLFWS